MARFTRIMTFPGYRWPAKELPVTLLRGAVLRDKATGGYLLQLKWQNLSEETLNYMQTRIEFFVGEPDAQELSTLEELIFEYEGLTVPAYESFGDKVPIRLPVGQVHSIIAKPIEIAYQDGKTWHAGSGWVKTATPRTAAPPPPPEAAPPSAQPAKARRQEAEPAPPQAGPIAAGPGLEPEGPGELPPVHRDRWWTSIWARVAAVVLVLGLIALYPLAVRPYLQYMQAGKLYDQRQYQDAQAAFLALGGYKDSAKRAEQCEQQEAQARYDTALTQLQAGNYQAAQQLFEQLNGFEDSAAYAQQAAQAQWDAAYRDAMELYEAGQYEQAKQALEALQATAASQDSLQLCQEALDQAAYDAARQLFDDGEYAEALAAFTALGDHLDSADWALVCGKLLAPPSTPAPTPLPTPQPTPEAPQALGVVTCISDKDARLRAEPNTQSEIVGKATRGDTFAYLNTIDGEDGGWYLLLLEDGSQAYLSQRLGKLDTSATPAPAQQPTPTPAPAATEVPGAAEPSASTEAPAVTPAPQRAMGQVTVTSGQDVSLRAAGRVDAPVVSSAQSGDVLICVGISEEGWYEVLLSDGQTAFVSPKLAAYQAS